MHKHIETVEKAEEKRHKTTRTYSKKREEEKRTIPIKVYVNQEEFKLLKSKAEQVGRDNSVYCREVALGIKFITIRETERWGALGRLGRQFMDYKKEVEQKEGVNPQIIDLLQEIIHELKKLRSEIIP